MISEREYPENPSTAEKFMFPARELVMSSLSEEIEEMENRTKNQIAKHSTVTINDTDADGLFCATLLSETIPSCGTTFSGHSMTQPDLSTVFQWITESDNTVKKLIISDICPNEEEMMKLEKGFSKMNVEEIIVYDHHNWSDELYDLFDTHCTMRVDSSDDVCTADLVYKYHHEDLPENLQETFAELVEATRDHDLWIKENPTGSDLATLQFAQSFDEYMDTITNHGIHFMTDTEIRSEVMDVRLNTEKSVEFGVKTSSWEEFDVSEWHPTQDAITVAFMYGDIYPGGSDVLMNGWSEWHTMTAEDGHTYQPVFSDTVQENESTTYPGWKAVESYEKYDEFLPEIEWEHTNIRGDPVSDYSVGDADIVFVIQPYNKVDLRSTENFPVCDVLANHIGKGGGHNKAAGMKPGIVGNTISETEHIVSRGHLTKAQSAVELKGLLQDSEFRETVHERIAESIADEIVM